MIRKVIVTGGTGVTGNALVRYLLNCDVEVTVLVRQNSSRLKNIPEHEKLRIVFCNLDEYSLIDEKLKGADYDAFFHLAWDGSLGKQKVDNRYNVPLQYKNVGCLIDAVELCNRLGCKKFITTGSQAEYGRVAETIDENTSLNPENAYGHAKNCAHGMAQILCDKYGIVLIWARLFSIFGPNDGAVSLVDTAIDALLKGESIDYSSGEQMWNYLYSFDAAKALYLLADKVTESDTYCVASSINRPLKEYIKDIHNSIDRSIMPRLGEKTVNAPIGLSVNTDKLIKATGFVEDYTFKEGIEEIVCKYKTTV